MLTWLIVGQTVAHYRISDLLSGGGMGLVYRAVCNAPVPLVTATA